MKIRDAGRPGQLIEVSKVGLRDRSRPLSEKIEIESGLVDLEEVLSDASRHVAISSFGQRLNAMYNDLKEIKDQSRREEAMAGMRAVVSELAGGPDPMDMADFALSAEGLGGLSPETLEGFFAASKVVKDVGFDLSRFVAAFVDSVGFDQGVAFLEAARGLAEAPPPDGEPGPSLKETMNRFVEGARAILNNPDLDADARMSRLAHLNEGVLSAGDAAEKQAFMDRYFEENPLPQGSDPPAEPAP